VVAESRPHVEKTVHEEKPQHVSQSFHAQLITNNNLAYKTVLEKSDISCLRSYNLMGKTDPGVGFPVVVLCNEGRPVFHPFHIVINYFKFSNLPCKLSAQNPSCDLIISLFLYHLSRLISEKFYVVIGLLFRNLRECLNVHGYAVIDEYFAKNLEGKKEEVKLVPKEGKRFCEVETCEYLPLISEKFLIEYLPEQCPEFEPQLGIDTMYDFCNWLLKKGFTKVKVRFREENPPIINK
jgi:hypothetical protein